MCVCVCVCVHFNWFVLLIETFTNLYVITTSIVYAWPHYLGVLHSVLMHRWFCLKEWMVCMPM